MKSYILFGLFLLSAISIFAQQKLEDYMQQVENNLLPAIEIDGENLQTYNLQERMKFYKVPGVSLTIIKDGKIHWSKSYGYADEESGRKVVIGTLFQAASISKPVAAVAALQLVEKGKLKLDADVNKYLKSWKVPENEFTKSEKVTLRRLLTHTAGLTVHGFRGYAQGEAVPSTIQVLNGEQPANSPAIFPDTIPGSLGRYSGGGYTVMQQMLEDVTGKPFAQIMQKNVLKKAGMSSSTYGQPLPADYQAYASYGYRSDGKKVEGNWHTYPEKAAAGLWTNPYDLAHFVIAIQQSLQGKSNLLSKEMTQQLLTKHLDDMGLGLALSGTGDSLIFSHNGANEGFRCQALGFAYLGSGVVIMTNSDNGMPLIQEITRSISKVYNWNTHKPRVKKRISLATAVLQKYAGTYQTEQGGKMELVVDKDKLLATQSWDGMQFNFYPESDITFFSLDNGYTATFNSNYSNEIKNITINGGWVLKRIKN